MEIRFTIHGNQEDPEGNPIPYVRSTRGALWRPEGKRYAEWKQYIHKCFLKSETNAQAPKPPYPLEPFLLGQSNKPITLETKQHARMEIKIFWANGAHGDPDNVWKGIADALFVNDKNLDGSFESQLAEDGKGRVEAEINIDG